MNLVGVDGDKWDDLLPLAVMNYNSTIHLSTGFSPYEIVFGKPMNLPSEKALEIQSKELEFSKDFIGTYVKQLAKNMEIIHSLSKQRIEKNQARIKAQFDKHAKPAFIFKIGDVVKRRKLQNSAEDLSSKLSPNWIGPCDVIKVLENGSYMIQERKIGAKPTKINEKDLLPWNEINLENSNHSNNKRKIIDSDENHSSENYFQPSRAPSKSELKKQREEEEETKIYEVDYIIDHKWETIDNKKQLFYKIKWNYYPHRFDTWEQLSELDNCQKAIDSYWEKKTTQDPKKILKKKRGRPKKN
jgi:hypothetical protein